MAEPLKDSYGPAEELARDLLPHLEAVANLNYLLDLHLADPEILQELRRIQDEAFNSILKQVMAHL